MGASILQWTLLTALPVVTIFAEPAIGEKVDDNEVPPTVYMFVLSTSVNHPLVTLAPVAAREPVIVKLLAPKSKLPPDTANPPVAEATVMFPVPSKLPPPLVLAVSNAVEVAAFKPISKVEVAAKARAEPSEFESRSELAVKEERPVPP